jgi:hypothetical protein
MKIPARAMVGLTVLTAAGCGGTPSSGGSVEPDAAAVTVTSSDGGLDFGPIGSPGSGACVPGAPSAFANAVCVCDDLIESGDLLTHSLVTGGAASVGVNGRITAGTYMNVEGSSTAYGGLMASGTVYVRDDVASTQAVDGAGLLSVGQDLSVGGTFDFAGALTVGGTLRLQSASTVLVPLHVGQTGPYVAPSGPPCGCDASALLPIAQAVAAAATTNDDAAHGLDPDGASLVALGSLTLTTGSYYFHDVTRLGVGTIDVQGAVSVYLDGQSLSIGAGQFSIASGSSLDLYVSGTLASAGDVLLGDLAHPEAFRLFVGGAGSMIATSGDQAWSGLVYAPQADVTFSGVTYVHGAIFAKSLVWAGLLDVSYAGGALSAGTSCPSPPPAATPH